MTRRGKLWARRIISTTLVLAVLGGLVYLVVLSALWVWGTLQESRQVLAEPTTFAPVEISECEPEDLSVVLSPNTRNLQVTEELTVQFRAQAKEGVECSLEPGALQVALTVGGYPVWTPTECSAGQDLLLLAKYARISEELKWNARIFEDCQQVGDLYAEEGIYELGATLNGRQVGKAVEIEIS